MPCKVHQCLVAISRQRLGNWTSRSLSGRKDHIHTRARTITTPPHASHHTYHSCTCGKGLIKDWAPKHCGHASQRSMARGACRRRQRTPCRANSGTPCRAAAAGGRTPSGFRHKKHKKNRYPGAVLAAQPVPLTAGITLKAGNPDRSCIPLPHDLLLCPHIDSCRVLRAAAPAALPPPKSPPAMAACGRAYKEAAEAAARANEIQSKPCTHF